MKKIISTLLTVSFLFSFSACTSSEEVSQDSSTITLEELEGWCEDSSAEFFEGFLERDYDKMASVSSVNFRSDFDGFFEAQDERVWLSEFYENYLLGSQAIPSVFMSSSQTGVVSLKYNIVCVDYTSGFKNWLLMYDTTVTFNVDTDTGTAYINNPEVIFDLYREMFNDWTAHVAATALGVNDDNFDLSQYYYDEETGMYVPYVTETDESDASSETEAQETSMMTVATETMESEEN